MSVTASDLPLTRDIIESSRNQLAFWPADAYTKDTSTPSSIFVGDGIVQDSVGYSLSAALSTATSITFNRELIGCLLFT